MPAKSSQHYQFEFRTYRRPFRQPLQTSQGLWPVREGIVLRLSSETGQIAYGEIAPLAWFGSETFEQAIAFCQQLSTKVTPEQISAIPSSLPACQFGFESACSALNTDPSKIQNPKSKISYSALLPSGSGALETWRSLWQQGFRTFKWKVGVATVPEELEILQTL